MTLKDENNFYLANQEKLNTQYGGRFIVITNQVVVGVFENEDEAYAEATEKYGLGNFLLKKCSNECYEQFYYSGVVC